MPKATNDLTEIMGIGSYVGETRRGPDGSIYKWVNGVDGLGNPIGGFWKKLKKLKRKALSLSKYIPGIGPYIHQARGAVKGLCRSLPQMRPFLTRIPAAKPYYRVGTKVCKIMRKVGLAGVEGEIMQAPDGQHYEVVQGIGEFGERKASLRPVRLIIPAQLRTGGQMILPRRVRVTKPKMRRVPKAAPQRRPRRRRSR